MRAAKSQYFQDRTNLTAERSSVALLLLDLINDLEWEGGEALAQPLARIAPAIAELADRARASGVPVIYVNDNYGRWRSDLRALVDHCLREKVRGRRIVELLQPRPDDYFVLKPKHSGFFSTTLELLLDHLGARALVLAGVAGNICVMFTAHDAHMRDFDLVVPRDCVASNTDAANTAALAQMADILGADTTPSAYLDWQRLAARADAR